MKIKPIIVVAGEPNSIFSEIFLKSIKFKRFKSPIILIGSLSLFKRQMKFLNLNHEINLINEKYINKLNLNNKKVNIINVEYSGYNFFGKISQRSNKYIEECFSVDFRILKKKITHKLINGPINKKYFLKNKYLGITEYISKKFNIRNYAMLIFNKKLAVCPITTHLPLKFVSKNITKKIIQKKILLINDFYLKKLKYKPRLVITGLNPHCESIDKFNEDEKIIKPTIKYLKKIKINIQGPFSADTIFLKENRKKFDVIIGMYHDQVLTPFKTLFEYDAVNITLGLPFLRLSPDHGPNEKMIKSNSSNPLSLIRALEFLDIL